MLRRIWDGIWGGTNNMVGKSVSNRFVVGGLSALFLTAVVDGLIPARGSDVLKVPADFVRLGDAHQFIADVTEFASAPVYDAVSYAWDAGTKSLSR